jgi:hypothetical protein
MSSPPTPSCESLPDQPQLPFSARLLAPISSNPVLGLGRARSSPSVPSGQAFPLAPCMSWTDLDRARVHIHILIHIHRRPIMLVCVYFCAQYQPEQSCSSLVELPRMKHLRGQALQTLDNLSSSPCPSHSRWCFQPVRPLHIDSHIQAK